VQEAQGLPYTCQKYAIRALPFMTSRDSWVTQLAPCVRTILQELFETIKRA
jgi:hypothetical protein